MTGAAAIDRHQSEEHVPRLPAASPLEIFRERCEARCLLIHNGLMDWHTAIDELQESAVAQGLVATHGQDSVQEIMADSFGRWRLANE
jgi:hypothetical protein